MKKGVPFKFPKSVLNQVEECSNGGYMLFVFNSDGEPTIYSKADSAPHSYAMHYFIENFAKATEAQNLETALQAMDGDAGEDDEEQG